MKFEWDEGKNRRNLVKHRVSFETAAVVFEDPNLVRLFDRVVEDEERWHCLGSIDAVTLLLVAHTYREEDGEEVIRIISARKATPRERRWYEKVARKRPSEIRALRKMKDSEIDLTDIPEIRDWSKAVVGKFYRPLKTSLTIRLDADVLAWLKSGGNGYQTRINSILRAAMEHGRRLQH